MKKRQPTDGKTKAVVAFEVKANMNEFLFIKNNKLTLLPPFDHKEAEDDDCGLPEHPILSNYSKYLWTSHRKAGGVDIGKPKVLPPRDRPFT
jgi:hypothetical protein